MNNPKVNIVTNLPEIGIPNDPLVLYNGNKLLLCYEVSHSDGKYAVIKYDRIIEYRVTPVNDEGLGKHKYAAYGLRWYSIHEIENAEESVQWEVLRPKYWVFCFKDRTVEILGADLKLIEKACDTSKLKSIVSAFIHEYV